MEEKSVELVTNPQKIVLLDKDDTKERLEKLEKKHKMCEKLFEWGYRTSIVSGSGAALFMGVSLNSKLAKLSIAASAASGVVSVLGVATTLIVAKREEKIEKEIKRVREALSLREEAKNNPNIVIEEKSAKQIQLEKKLEKYDKISDITGTFVSVGAVVGAGIGCTFLAKYLDVDLLAGMGIGMCFGMGVGSVPMAGPLVKRDRVKQQLEETVKTEHPEFYKQKLLTEMGGIVKSNADAPDLQDNKERYVLLDNAYKLAQKCDSTEVIERLVNLAKNMSPDNAKELNHMVVNGGKEMG